MKSVHFIPALAAFSSLVAAKALLAVLPPTITIGEVYEVEWLADKVESLELLLVKQFPGGGGWSPERQLFQNVTGTVPSGSYTWTVNDSYPIGGAYALWLSSTHIPDDGTGYASLEGWFEFVEGDDQKSNFDFDTEAKGEEPFEFGGARGELMKQDLRKE